jgi:AcrR family transcriptional regulator
MPRKNLFSKEMFVDAAFKILREKGRDKLSARSLARELKCSTMPVYSYLKSMSTLVTDLEKKAIALMLTYQTTGSTGQPFLDIGIGYVLFARNEKNLFRFLFARTERRQRHARSPRRVGAAPDDLFGLLFAGTDGGFTTSGKALREIALASLIEQMKKDPAVGGLDETQLKSILMKMWIFTHGLAFMATNDLLIENDEPFIRDTLHETGRFVIDGEINKQRISQGGLR